MVIDHGIRQQVALAGSRMIQAAESGDLDAALQMTVWGRRAVGRCLARWRALPESVRRELQEPAGRRAAQAEEAAWQLLAASEEIGRARRDVHGGTLDGLGERLELIARHIASAAAASRPAGRGTSRAGEARPRGSVAEDAGERFLRDLAAGPGQVPAVRSWLRPAHFARLSHGHLCALICDMHAAGKPVDPVTVAWEAARRGVPADAGELDGGTAPFAVASGREVHRHGYLAWISWTGREISATARDPEVSLSALLRNASQRLDRLEREPGPQSGRQGSQGSRSRSAGRAEPAASPRLTRTAAEPCGGVLARQRGAGAEPA